MSISASGPQHPIRPSSSTNTPKVRLPKTDGFLDVLSGLGIDGSDIISLSLLKGLQTDLNLPEAQLVEITPQHQSVLDALGLKNAHLAIAVSDENEIDRLKKKFKEIRKTAISTEQATLLSEHLGINISDDNVLFSDSAGGIIFVKSGFEEIASSVDD